MHPTPPCDEDEDEDEDEAALPSPAAREEPLQPLVCIEVFAVKSG